jgi:hypothetical protein
MGVDRHKSTLYTGETGLFLTFKQLVGGSSPSGGAYQSGDLIKRDRHLFIRFGMPQIDVVKYAAERFAIALTLLEVPQQFS